MSIVYVGAYEHEVALGIPDSTSGRFDPDYAPYGVSTFPFDGTVWTTFTPVKPGTTTYNCWVHFKCFRVGGTGGTGVPELPIMEILGAGGNLLVVLDRTTNNAQWRIKTNGASSPAATVLNNAQGYFPQNYLITYDFNIRQTGTNHEVDFYVNGILQASLTRANTAQWELEAVRFSPVFANHQMVISEMIMTHDEPTIGARLASQRPTGASSFNSWEGTWAALGDNDTGSGISTDQDNSRISGGFQAYNGTTSPVGIRAVVQANYYVDNDSGLEISSYLRESGTDEDAFDFQASDFSRVFTVWDENPISADYWAVADLATVDGGVRTTPA